jgi:BTB/POZ domain
MLGSWNNFDECECKIEVELKCKMDEFTSYTAPSKLQFYDDGRVDSGEAFFNNWVVEHYYLKIDKDLTDCELIVRLLCFLPPTTLPTLILREFQVGTETIKAHRSILSHFSPIFRTYFTHPAAEEAETGKVRVNGFPIGAVGHFRGAPFPVALAHLTQL